MKGSINEGSVTLSSQAQLTGLTLTKFQIETGSKSFEDYTNEMVKDMGRNIRPNLKSFYMSSKYSPGFNTEGMDSSGIVDKANVDKIIKQGVGNSNYVITPNANVSDIDGNIYKTIRIGNQV